MAQRSNSVRSPGHGVASYVEQTRERLVTAAGVGFYGRGYGAAALCVGVRRRCTCLVAFNVVAEEKGVGQ